MQTGGEPFVLYTMKPFKFIYNMAPILISWPAGVYEHKCTTAVSYEATNMDNGSLI